MSTKIYNAYKYKGTLDSLHTYLQKLKTDYYKHCLNEVNTHLGSQDIEELCKYNNIHPGFINISQKTFSDLCWPDKAKVIEGIMKKGYNDTFNFSATSMIYTYKNELYIIFFGLNKVLNKRIESSKLFIDYHYQDQTDPYYTDLPGYKDFSKEKKAALAKEYNQRIKIWDKILIGDSFADNSFLFDFFTKNSIWKVSQESLSTTKPYTIQDEK